MINIKNYHSSEKLQKITFNTLKQLIGKRLQKVEVRDNGAQEFHFDVVYKNLLDTSGNGKLVLLVNCRTNLTNWKRESIKNYVFIKQEKSSSRGEYKVDYSLGLEFQNRYEDLLCHSVDTFKVIKVTLDHLNRIELIFNNYNHKLLIAPLIPTPDKMIYQWALRGLDSEDPLIYYNYKD